MTVPSLGGHYSHMSLNHALDDDDVFYALFGNDMTYLNVECDEFNLNGISNWSHQHLSKSLNNKTSSEVQSN